MGHLEFLLKNYPKSLVIDMKHNVFDLLSLEDVLFTRDELANCILWDKASRRSSTNREKLIDPDRLGKLIRAVKKQLHQVCKGVKSSVNNYGRHMKSRIKDHRRKERRERKKAEHKKKIESDEQEDVVREEEKKRK
ncbi:hypothetical protein BpHYR1_020418, partial [Brachionus plicatilis]